MAVIRQEDLNLLNAAAKSTDVTVVEEALRNAADKNCREIGGYEFTALHRAIYSNESIAWVLVKEPGVCLNEKDTLGHTPLHLAWRGCVPLMEKYCTTKEVLWDLEDNIGQTPLLYHARLGNDTSLKALLRRTEVSISKITMDGFTALHQVVEQDRRFLPHWRELLSADKRCELVGILLDMKMEKARIERAFQRKSVEAEDLESDVLDFVNTKDVLNRSVLHYIAEEGCVAILDKLLKWFAVKEVKDRVDVTTLDVHGCAPLLLAVQRGHRDMVRELLKLKQIDPNVPATVIESRPSELKPYEENHKQLCRPNLFSKAPTEQYSGTDITPLHFAVNVKPQFEVAAALLLDERTKIVDNERWEMFDKVGAAMILIQGAKDCVECSKILQFF
jgi:ankyrin repeat protein